VIYTPRIHQEIKYPWGIREATNKTTKTLALYKALELLTSLTRNLLIVMGYSFVIISAMRTKVNLASSTLAKLIHWDKTISKLFYQTHLYHVYRAKYTVVDEITNTRVMLWMDCCKCVEWKRPHHYDNPLNKFLFDNIDDKGGWNFHHTLPTTCCHVN